MKVSRCFKFILYISILIVLMRQYGITQVSDTIYVNPGWNLLSLPVKAIDSTVGSLFPTAKSDAFIYQGSYLPKDTLRNGYGFWLKFDSAKSVAITGEPIQIDTINVSAGWNIIGSLPIHVSLITTEPNGIISSAYFYYANEYGYQSSDILYPGFGYWIKADRDGLIILMPWLPCPNTPTVEYEGRIYNTVQIGNQCWIKENIDIGTMILGSDSSRNNDTIEKYCYSNMPANCEKYGGLYQWNEAMQYADTPKTRGICPSGWHIPTVTEFQILEITVNNHSNPLKGVGQGSGDGTGTNISGFTALLEGYRGYSGLFNGLGNSAFFWSSSEYSTLAVSIGLYNNSNQIDALVSTEEDGLSVRCIKD
jgi:uncharacterized protein (TIGR02145 family)